jgi:hypothetical protein
LTAAEIARAVGISKRSVLAAMAAVQPRSVKIISGNPADTWPLADLPESLRARLDRAAQLTGCRDVASHLAAPAVPWQPPVPLSQIAGPAIDKAANLRRALARSLELRDNPGISSRELEAIGVEDYRRIFGYAITDRHFRALLKRTIERDNFAENWNRLEIYLDGNPPRKCAATSPDGAAAGDFRELHDLLASFKSATAPTGIEREALWENAIALFEFQTSAGADKKRARRALLDFLWNSAPWLAKSRHALHVAFQFWCERKRAGEPIKDLRRAKKGIPTAPAIPQKVVDAVVGNALFASGGRISQAVRAVADRAEELGIEGTLAETLFARGADKSFVNHRLRNAVTADVRMAEPYLLGGRALDTARAWLDRDYSNLASGLCFSSDDVTLPVYWFVPDGKDWFNLVRGQCLVTIDFRSLRILGFSLQPDRNYSSPVIHTMFAKVFADWGVPQHLYLECGIWKNSRLITGGPKAARVPAGWEFMPLSWTESERGFGDLGVTFLHAIRARSKVVERVIGLVQDQMEAEPGYCGRDERRDCPEITKRRMDDVKFRRVHPGDHFYDGNQWEARLREIFAAYNTTPQGGKILAGLSPDAAFEQFQDAARAPMLFGDNCRHLLAHFKIPVEVGNNGITIRIGKKSFVYRNEQTGRDKYQRKLAWFNPEEPSILAVTDLNMKNPYSVPISNSVDALNPNAEALAVELARVAEHERYGKTRYSVLKANYAPLFRRVVPDRAAVRTGDAIRQQRADIEQHREKHADHARAVHRRAGAVGLPPRILNVDAQADEGTRMMLEAKRAHVKEQAATAQPKNQ